MSKHRFRFDDTLESSISAVPRSGEVTPRSGATTPRSGTGTSLGLSGTSLGAAQRNLAAGAGLATLRDMGDLLAATLSDSGSSTGQISRRGGGKSSRSGDRSTRTPRGRDRTELYGGDVTPPGQRTPRKMDSRGGDTTPRKHAATQNIEALEAAFKSKLGGDVDIGDTIKFTSKKTFALSHPMSSSVQYRPPSEIFSEVSAASTPTHYFNVQKPGERRHRNRHSASFIDREFLEKDMEAHEYLGVNRKQFKHDDMECTYSHMRGAGLIQRSPLNAARPERHTMGKGMTNHFSPTERLAKQWEGDADGRPAGVNKQRTQALEGAAVLVRPRSTPRGGSNRDRERTRDGGHGAGCKCRLCYRAPSARSARDGGTTPRSGDGTSRRASSMKALDRAAGALCSSTPRMGAAPGSSAINRNSKNSKGVILRANTNKALAERGGNSWKKH